MSYTRIRIHDAFEKLPPEEQGLIMSSDTTEVVETALEEINLDKEAVDLADSEILYAMYCLQSLDDAINNIAKMSGKSAADLSRLKSTLQEEIFNQYKIDINDFIESNKRQTSEPVQTTERTRDQIKESLIKRREGGEIGSVIPSNLPEIAPEIHPMIEPPFAQGFDGAREGEKVHDAAPETVVEHKKEPIFITTQEEKEKELGHPSKKWVPNYEDEPEEKPKDSVSVPDYRYPDGTDPYREPVK